MRSPAGKIWHQSRAVRLASRGLWLALWLLVSWLALRPGVQPEPPTGWDKLDHLLAFAGLACVAVPAWGRRRRLHAAAGLLVYGALIELLQTQIPGRSGEFGDGLADALGIGLGLLVAGVVFARPPRE